jgi:small subunit ribosomal protein S6
LNQYEGMFLFDPTFGANFEACEGEVRRLMDRAEADLVFCKKWDERRLAYRVKGRKRGVYVLTYFKCAPDKITPLNRDVQISESILRALFLRADDVTPELMERAIEQRGESMTADEDDDRRGDSDGRRGGPDGRPNRYRSGDDDRGGSRRFGGPDGPRSTGTATAEAPAAKPSEESASDGAPEAGKESASAPEPSQTDTPANEGEKKENQPE